VLRQRGGRNVAAKKNGPAENQKSAQNGDASSPENRPPPTTINH
jgi:hypothetical protein